MSFSEKSGRLSEGEKASLWKTSESLKHPLTKSTFHGGEKITCINKGFNLSINPVCSRAKLKPSIVAEKLWETIVLEDLSDLSTW